MRSSRAGRRNRALFLDRDGVLTVPVNSNLASERAPWTLDELEIVPAARRALDLAVRAGFVPIVVTNQPDVARGNLSKFEALSINEALTSCLPQLKHVYLCMHAAEDRCECRKPNPGLIMQATEDLGLDLSASWMVGDRWVDISAGKSVGCRCVLIRRLRSWFPNSSGAPSASLAPDKIVADVLEAVHWIVGEDDD